MNDPEIKQLLMDTLSEIRKMQSDITIIKQMQAEQAGKNASYDKKFQNVETSLTRLDAADRSRNILMFGVEETEEKVPELHNKIKTIIRETEVNIEDVCICDIFRIGRKEAKKTRPVLIKLIAPRWKYEFFEKSPKFTEQGITVKADMSKEHRDIIGKLLKARYILRLRGHEPALIGNKLYMGKRALTDQQIENIILDESREKLKENHTESEPLELAKTAHENNTDGIKKVEKINTRTRQTKLTDIPVTKQTLRSNTLATPSGGKKTSK